MLAMPILFASKQMAAQTKCFTQPDTTARIMGNISNLLGNTLQSIKLVRIKIHIIQNANNTATCMQNNTCQNFPSNNAAEIAVAKTYTRNLIDYANTNLSNLPMNLPCPSPPISSMQPTNFRYLFDENTDLYFHPQPEITATNSIDVIGMDYTHLSVNPQTYVNIFFLYYSNAVATPSFISSNMSGSANGVGYVGFSPFVKLVSPYQAEKLVVPSIIYNVSTLLNHEVGHLLGLDHTFVNDDCSDTPLHQNQWNSGCYCSNQGAASTVPPYNIRTFNDLQSNNVMDYNPVQRAWTACQLDKVNYNLKFYSCVVGNPSSYCTKDPNFNITITQNQTWNYTNYLAGDLIITTGNKLTIKNAYLNMPEGGKIIIQNGATLDKSKNTAQIVTKDLSIGVYIVEIQADEKTMNVQKLNLLSK